MGDASSPDPNDRNDSTVSARFAGRVFFILAVVALAYVATRLTTLILMATGAVVVAVLIHMVSDPLHQRLKVPKKLATIAAIALIFLFLGGLGWLFGSQIAAQGNTLANELPRSLEEVRASLSGTFFGDMVLNAMDQAEEQAGAAFSYVRGLVSNVVNSFVAIVVIIVAGIVLATQPITYRDGILLLAPKDVRGRLRSVMNACGRSLKGWLVGQLIAMAAIAFLVSIGLLIVGIPSWLILGLLAGLAQFVPLIGPIISAVPGLIIAGSMGPGPLIGTFFVYWGVQQIESNWLTPYVMNRTASLPMVLTLFAIIAFTTLFGVMGAIFATPITVILYVAVQMLYIEDRLGEKLHVQGERSHSAAEGH